MGLFASARMGQQSGSFGSFDFSGANTDNEIATIATYPAPIAGILRILWAFFAGDGVAVDAQLAAWKSPSGDVSAVTPHFTAPAGTHAAGGQSLNRVITDGTSDVFGTDRVFWFGWGRAKASSHVWSVAASGSFNHKTNASADVETLVGAAACGGAYTCGDVEAFGLVVGVPVRKEYGLENWAAYKKRGGLK